MPANNTAVAPDYTSDMWIHIEHHVEVHCFGTFNTNSARRARHLSQRRPSNIIKVIREAAEDIAGGGHEDNKAIYRLMSVSLSEGFSTGMVEAIHTFLNEINHHFNLKIWNYLHYMTTMPALEQSKEAVSDLISRIEKVYDPRSEVACELLVSAQALIEAADATLKSDARLAREERREVKEGRSPKTQKHQTIE